MRIQAQRMTCKCGHVWDAELVLEAEMSISLASMKAVRCPKCGKGSRYCYLGGSYNDAPPLSAPIEDRMLWWFQRGDTGTSSLTIFCAFTGGESPHREFNFPHDPDDFQRCKRLLDLLPEWRADLSPVVSRFPWLKPFIDRWDRFDELYAEQLPDGSCPKLYAEIQRAEKEAEKLRRAQEVMSA